MKTATITAEEGAIQTAQYVNCVVDNLSLEVSDGYASMTVDIIGKFPGTDTLSESYSNETEFAYPDLTVKFGTSLTNAAAASATPVKSFSLNIANNVQLDEAFLSGSNEITISSSIEPYPHSASHQDGGIDEIVVSNLLGELADPQKVTIRVNNGTDVGSRPRLNFISGSNIFISASEDIVNDEIDILISSSVSGGGSGEINTASNIGSGEGIFAQKFGVDLQFRSLTGSGSVSIISGSDTINISSSYSNGSNIGSGEGVLANVSSGSFTFRSLIGSGSISIISGSDYILISGSTVGGSTGTLDTAYDGGGSGNGRNISIDAGPISMEVTSSVGLAFSGSTTAIAISSSFTTGITSPGTGSQSERFGANSLAGGNYSVAIGCNASSPGNSAIALGYNSIAGGEPPASKQNSIAIGANALAPNTSTVAIGAFSTASGSSVAVGYNARAFGTNTVVIGENSVSGPGQDCVVLGSRASTSAPSQAAIAIGLNAYAAGTAGAAVGKFAYAVGSAVAVGYFAKASGSNAIAMGAVSIANASYAVAVGSAATAGASYAVAVGQAAEAATTYSTAIGKSARAVGASYNLAVGYNAQARSNACIAIGPNSDTTVSGGIAFGYGANVPLNSGPNAIAIGGNASAKGPRSIAFGLDSSASFEATGSIAIGASALTSITSSIAIGEYASATGSLSIAIGGNAKAYATESIAIGQGAKATAVQRAIVIGQGASSSGNQSVTIGWRVSGAMDAVVLGTSASGTSNSIVIGTNAQATTTNQIVLGQSAQGSGQNTCTIGSNAYPFLEYVLGSGSVGASNQLINNTTIRVTNASGTNNPGGQLIIAGGRGTGTAAGGSVIFKISSSGSSGTTLNSLKTKTSIDEDATRFYGSSEQTTQIKVAEETLSLLSGTSVDTIGLGRIPAMSTLFYVTTRVITAISGASNIDIGVAGDVTRYADDIAVASGSLNVGIDSSGFVRQYVALTPIRISSGDGVTAFTGGTIKVSIHYIEATAPSS